MGRHNVYINDELEDLVTSLELPLSALLQNAIRDEAARRGVHPQGMQRGPSRYQKEQGITRGPSRGWDGGMGRGEDGW